ncbi:hypothetical protein EBB05_29835 (plasmid) [Methylobacterium brachiatum]|nr:hypothetical protein EBB05_29835 [Methylobacterium brachiatum]
MSRRRGGLTARRRTAPATATPTGTARTLPARGDSRAGGGAKGGDDVMRLLPLLVVFAVLAAGIGYALA